MMKTEFIVILVVCVLVFILLASFISYKGIKYLRNKRIKLEMAEEEMRNINYEFNTKNDGNVKLNWEFCLNKDNLGKIHVINRVDIKFIDTCSLQTDAPLLPISNLNYFEIFFLDLPRQTVFYIGLAPKQSDNLCMPGAIKDSIGLNCQKAIIEMNGKHLKKPECEIIQGGDVVGLFYNPFKNEFYFTLNGTQLKKHTFKTNELRLYPTIYGHGPCKIQYNFGFNRFSFKPANDLHYGIASNSPLDNVPPDYNENGGP